MTSQPRTVVEAKTDDVPTTSGEQQAIGEESETVVVSEGSEAATEAARVEVGVATDTSSSSGAANTAANDVTVTILPWSKRTIDGLLLGMVLMAIVASIASAAAILLKNKTNFPAPIPFSKPLSSDTIAPVRNVLIRLRLFLISIGQRRTSNTFTSYTGFNFIICCTDLWWYLKAPVATQGQLTHEEALDKTNSETN